MTTRRILSCILLPAYLSSCMSWQVQGVSPRELIEEDQPSQIMVRTTTSDSAILLDNPRVSGDSVIGTPLNFSWASSSYAVSDLTVSIPLAAIAQISVKKIDEGKTFGMIVGVALVALLIAKVAHELANPPCKGKPDSWSCFNGQPRPQPR